MRTTILTIRQQLHDSLAEHAVAVAQVACPDRHRWDHEIVDQAIEAFAEAGQPFSAEDVRELLPDVRQTIIGSRFMSASARRYIRKVGRVTSTSPPHAKCVAVWVIVDPPAPHADVETPPVITQEDVHTASWPSDGVARRIAQRFVGFTADDALDQLASARAALRGREGSWPKK